MNRPTFRLDGKSIRAVFFDLYLLDAAGQVEHLMQYKKGRLEEFGGKTAVVDYHYLDTGVREAMEESNNVLTKDELLEAAQEAINRRQYILQVVDRTCPSPAPVRAGALRGPRSARQVVYVPHRQYCDAATPMHPRMSYRRYLILCNCKE
jgi:hypothetical protein